ncbi:Uncharacterized protein C11G11.07 [Ceratocystis fimbriata CBS 114723]|uniref:Uncharacterized protein C11G11.07 n=1 Tax=Ceratocystis fimbriata CBS 114723 TaxID=1035309 RepID=A0A2C5XJ26_9PEZI|nr:Uncharacterized protein C11G11.07 [Ceratocystis fimbriata CBS 114723]
MASVPSTEVFRAEDVLAAVVTMRGGDVEAKKKAQEFLQNFQKSNGSWATIISILQSSADDEAKLFAVITLRGKITYDLSTQIPQDQVAGLRDQLLLFLAHFASGPKAIRVQLCVSLAVLAIQMTGWKDVLPTVVNALNSSHAAILDFLRVLPEEVTDGRKITLTSPNNIQLRDQYQILWHINFTFAIILPPTLHESSIRDMILPTTIPY